MSKEQAECLRTLKLTGYKWNIETKVGYNVELHQVVEILGHEHISFVAELDSYGNIVEWGLYEENRKVLSNKTILNADDEEVA